MPIPSRTRDFPITRPMTAIYNRVPFYAPIMLPEFRQRPVPFVTAEPKVTAQPSAELQDLFGGAVDIADFYRGSEL